MRWLKGMLAVAAVVAGFSTMPTAASAAQCPTGYFCVWEHAWWGGAQANWYGNDGDWSIGWDHPYMHNRDSSWQNAAISGSGGGYDKVKVYDCLWYSCSVTVHLQPGEYYGYLAGANDRGSSHKWVRGW